MNEKLFRKKSIQRVSSPEQLTDYIRVASPGLWLALGAVLVFVLGACVWASLGTLTSEISAMATCENGRLHCYVHKDDIGKVKINAPAHSDTQDLMVYAISHEPEQAGEVMSDYALYLSQLEGDEWVYTVTLMDSRTGTDPHHAAHYPLTEGTYPVSIVTEIVSPIAFVFERGDAE